ncbi:glutamyl-tRNA(Gln) amidotransferase subunit B, mitochondrial isoform X1 [Colletes latitarsis]|uniref:glutamyl-tRNA(Gln) amidotransferase subunit B, mitochondrial isoform X1 n=1 Tax=Colletes latitarsis TaxID=2605962 RepID=UPI004036B465
MILCKNGHIFVRNYCKNAHKRCYLRYASTNLAEWKPTIGLEIHAQIASKSKLFSGASTKFQSSINSCVSLFDCATPGTMPILNKKCVEAGILTALALSCKVNDISTFERKHYFYSDLPAGFQITQHKNPLAVDGEIKFMVFNPSIHKEPYLKSSKIKQIQLEQDSGRSYHNESLGRSLIDLNRAGLPLMELVFEPDLSNGEEAAALVKELCLILQLINTCSCKMEEGALRVDVNVSISKHDAPLGVRTEIKNIGSTRAVNNAIECEIKRQISILESGGEIINETRLWDPICKKTILMREKEENHDYRFMPEPNLPPLYLHISESKENKHNLINVLSLKEHLPELPEQIRQTIMEDYCITPHMTIGIMSNLELLQLFCNIIKNDKNRNPTLVAQILLNEIVAFLQRHDLEFTFCTTNISYIEELIDLFHAKIINFQIVRKILNQCLDGLEKKPIQIVEENNWFCISNEEELEKLCIEIIEKNPKLVQKYKAGKTKVFKKFLHEAIKITDDRADMGQISKIFTRLLS